MKKLDYKWTALILLWVAFFLQQGTRQLFGPSIPAICNSIGCDMCALGVVGSVFAMMYGICVPFAGIAADLFRRKWMVVIGVAIFCLGIFASGFIASAAWLILTYGILNGLGQSFYYPSASSLVAQLHRDSRATAMSILQLGLYIGIVGCGTLAGFLAGEGGDNWRMSFLIFGGIGLVWAFFMIFALKDTKAEVSNVITDKPTIGEALSAVFSKPTAICVILGLAMMIYVDIGFKNWMPTFLRDNYMQDCPFLSRWYGLHAVLWHYLGAIVGILIGSRIGDKLVKIHPKIRLDLGIIGLGLAIPFIIWMANASSFFTCAVAMLIFGLFRGIYDSNFMASFFDVVNPRYHASGVGIMMCIAFLFGSLSSAILPIIASSMGNMTLSMSSLAIFYFIGALVIFFGRLRSKE